MEIIIEEIERRSKDGNKRCYFSFRDRIMNEEMMARELEIDYELYCSILKKYGAEKLFYNSKDLYFNSKEDALKCLDDPELEPYIMMLKLV